MIAMTHWLFPEEQPTVVRSLLELGLIKFSDKRDLPLKSGGKTDIYISLRDARNNPSALEYLAELYKMPVRHSRASRFVEVPESVSCFAGLLAVKTGVPYLTIREQLKEGRATDAQVIGKSEKGEDVVIMDDVITDGASKIEPYLTCLRLGLNPKRLIVLVDRQQGWQKKFQEKNIDLPVWPGMSLHDVRRELILSGAMRRCDPGQEARNPIIVALDGKSWEEILPFVDRFRTTGVILKVNDLLFALGIERLLRELSIYGRIMADLKCHDIPATVSNTCKRLRPFSPWAVTVHGSGGPDMVAAAVKALEGTPTKVLGVTVLTSIDAKTCEEIYVRQPREQVMRIAEMVKQAGGHGLVCSPEEVRELRTRYPGFNLTTPGVRSPGVGLNDQARTGTPAVAMEDGADNLVMGRQLLGDQGKDPIDEMNRVLVDELKR